MTENIEKLLIGISGGVIGFALPHAAKLWDRLTKTRRIKTAIINDMRFAMKDIENKNSWLSRDVSGHLNEVDMTRVVVINNMHLYLGEKESFILRCKYWEDKYCDIVETLSDDDFTEYSTIHRLFSRYTLKFMQMKEAFETELGDSKEMAKACYKDLIKITKDIEQNMHRLTTG